MPNQDSSGFINKFKNYFINIVIVILAVLTLYLFYNFVKRTTTDQPEEKTPAADNTLQGITKQHSSKTHQIKEQNGNSVQEIESRLTE